MAASSITARRKCPSIISLHQRFGPSSVTYASKGDLIGSLNRAATSRGINDDQQLSLAQLDPNQFARLCSYFVPSGPHGTSARYRINPAKGTALAMAAVEYQGIYSDLEGLLSILEALAAAAVTLPTGTADRLSKIILARLRHYPTTLVSDAEVNVRFLSAACRTGIVTSELLSRLRGDGLAPTTLLYCLDALTALSGINSIDGCEALVEDLRLQARVLLSTSDHVSIETNPVRVLNLFTKAPGGDTQSSQAFLRFIASKRISSTTTKYVKVEDWVELAGNLKLIVGDKNSVMPSYIVRLVLLLVQETFPRLRSLSVEQLTVLASGLWSSPIRYVDDLYSITLVESLLQYKTGITPEEWVTFIPLISHIHPSLQRKLINTCRSLLPTEAIALLPKGFVKDRPTNCRPPPKSARKQGPSDIASRLPRLPPSMQRAIPSPPQSHARF